MLFLNFLREPAEVKLLLLLSDEFLLSVALDFLLSASWITLLTRPLTLTRFFEAACFGDKFFS